MEIRRGKSWLLALNGMALIGLGLVLNGAFGSTIGFRTLALLVVAAAVSIGLLELVFAAAMRRQDHAVDSWALRLAGAASVGFAIAFLGFALGWIDLAPRPSADFLLFGLYFGFSAMCMLGLGLRLNRLRANLPAAPRLS